MMYKTGYHPRPVTNKQLFNGNIAAKEVNLRKEQKLIHMRFHSKHFLSTFSDSTFCVKG